MMLAFLIISIRLLESPDTARCDAALTQLQEMRAYSVSAAVTLRRAELFRATVTLRK